MTKFWEKGGTMENEDSGGGKKKLAQVWLDVSMNQAMCLSIFYSSKHTTQCIFIVLP